MSGSSLMRPTLQWCTVDGVPAPAQVAYLARLDTALVGPLRPRRSLLREAADHLEDATEALVEAGYHPEDAARRAVADFGDIDAVAPAFQEALGVAASRRTAWLLMIALGAQPFLWDEGLQLASANELSAPDTSLYVVLDRAIELGGSVILVGALLALIATGIGSRWLPARRLIARATAAFALTAAIAMPALCIAMAAMSEATFAFWTLITLLTIAPLATVALSARQTLAAT